MGETDTATAVSTDLNQYYENIVRCKLCSELCQDVAEFIIHSSTKHPEIFVGNIDTTSETSNVFVCASCNTLFEDEGKFAIHLENHHGLSLDNHVDDNVDTRVNENGQVQTQMEGSENCRSESTHAAASLESCSLCRLTFESAEVKMLHEACHSSQLEFICIFCKSCPTFKGWRDCQWHIWKEHDIDCELYSCSICFKFKTHMRSRLLEHEDSHSKFKRQRICRFCNKKFKDRRQLILHEDYHTETGNELPPPEDNRWYTKKECPICKRVLANSKCLKIHISAVHNKLKPYVCQICGYKSARKHGLMLHIRQHTSEKPYTCDQCSFKTGDHNSLRRHKMIHMGKQAYSCPLCNYKCIQSIALKKHAVSVHPDQTVVYFCTQCNYTTVNENSFESHQLDHAEGRIISEAEAEISNTASNGIRRTSPIPSADQRPNENPKALGSATKFWLGEEDSCDVVDTGGITIPAPTLESTN